MDGGGRNNPWGKRKGKSTSRRRRPQKHPTKPTKPEEAQQGKTERGKNNHTPDTLRKLLEKWIDEDNDTLQWKPKSKRANKKDTTRRGRTDPGKTRKETKPREKQETGSERNTRGKPARNKPPGNKSPGNRKGKRGGRRSSRTKSRRKKRTKKRRRTTAKRKTTREEQPTRKKPHWERIGLVEYNPEKRTWECRIDDCEAEIDTANKISHRRKNNTQNNTSDPARRK